MLKSEKKKTSTNKKPEGTFCIKHQMYGKDIKTWAFSIDSCGLLAFREQTHGAFERHKLKKINLETNFFFFFFLIWKWTHSSHLLSDFFSLLFQLKLFRDDERIDLFVSCLFPSPLSSDHSAIVVTIN